MGSLQNMWGLIIFSWRRGAAQMPRQCSQRLAIRATKPFFANFPLKSLMAPFFLCPNGLGSFLIWLKLLLSPDHKRSWNSHHESWGGVSGAAESVGLWEILAFAEFVFVSRRMKETFQEYENQAGSGAHAFGVPRSRDCLRLSAPIFILCIL